MSALRELMADERSVMSAGSAVLASLLGALVILGGGQCADSAADLYERASRGVIRVDAGGEVPFRHA